MDKLVEMREMFVDLAFGILLQFAILKFAELQDILCNKFLINMNNFTLCDYVEL